MSEEQFTALLSKIKDDGLRRLGLLEKPKAAEVLDVDVGKARNLNLT